MWDWGECVVSPEPFTHRAFPCKGNLTIFNKALAVGADGTLLAVHHKHHLAHALMAKEQTSMERGSVVINPSPWGVFNDDVGSAWPVPAVTIFTSHFGVKFGLVTCHELNFASPFLSILKAWAFLPKGSVGFASLNYRLGEEEAAFLSSGDSQVALLARGVEGVCLVDKRRRSGSLTSYFPSRSSLLALGTSCLFGRPVLSRCRFCHRPSPLPSVSLERRA